MSDSLKRWLIFLGVVIVGIVVYIYPKARITPRDKMGALAGAKADVKASSEGDLKSLPPGKIRLHGLDRQQPRAGEYPL